MAFADGAVESSVLSLCAALAGRDRGSARQALDILRLAGENAENTDADAITEAHVEDAQDQLEQERVEEGMRQLTVNGHYTLLAVVSRAASDATPSRYS